MSNPNSRFDPRNSAEAHAERRALREACTPGRPSVDNPDLTHCLAIVRALGGQGLPVCNFGAGK